MRDFSKNVIIEEITAENINNSAIVFFTNDCISYVIYDISKIEEINGELVLYIIDDIKYIIKRNGNISDEYGYEYSSWKIIDINEFIKEFKIKSQNNFSLFCRYAKFFKILHKKIENNKIKMNIKLFNKEIVDVKYNIEDVINYIL